MKIKKKEATLIKIIFLMVLLFSASCFPSKNSSSIHNGEALFNSYCIMCHQKNNELIGPALNDICQRRNRSWLYQMIRNGDELVKRNDKEAINLYSKYKIQHPPFTQFSKKQLNDILSYLNQP